MKDIIKFILFISYSSIIFFIPNTLNSLICFILINLLVIIFSKINIKKVFESILKFLPFILFTCIINCVLDEIKNAIWIGIKLILVCNITYVYAKTTTINQIATTIQKLCSPLKIFKIDTEEIKIMVAVALSMIPVMRKDMKELKETSKVKNIQLNLKNMRIILSKYFVSLIKKVNDIDEALKEKGFDC